MRSRRLWLSVLVAAAVVRLLTLAAYPLFDTTEARYAEIARLMVVSGDWITPQIEMGVPFWAKPPLSTWLTASSFELLGFGEFAARIPAYLLTLLSTALVFRLGQRLFSTQTAVIGCAILLTSSVGFVASGAVMTDATLMFATTVSMASFCMTIYEPRPFRRYGVFIGLGLGMLAKGPIALVLVGLPILVWSLWHRSFAWLWRAIPWVTGSILMLAIAGPWYLLAEIKTPGFLEYFLLGEHWFRFVESGWQGDLYGSAHSHPRGMIWLFGIVAALPWSIVAVYAAGKAVKESSILRSMTPIQAFLLLWVLTPLVFFTFSGNILATYVLPGLPAFALILGEWLSNRSRLFAHLGWLVPGLVAGAIMTGSLDNVAYKSQRDLIEYYDEMSPSSGLYYFHKVPYSASFYSSGAATAIRPKPGLSDFLASTDDQYIVVRKEYSNEFPNKPGSCLRTAKEFGDYLLLEKHGQCRQRNQGFN